MFFNYSVCFRCVIIYHISIPAHYNKPQLSALVWSTYWSRATMSRFHLTVQEWCLHYRNLLENKTDKSSGDDGCWLYTGRKSKSGHGMVDVVIPWKGKTVRSAHRLAYLTSIHGSWELSSQLQASHLCGRPQCIKISHLVLESHEDNKSRQICHGMGQCSSGLKHKPKCIILPCSDLSYFKQ